ncbi:Protein-tyrosine phosphatase, low molecular weight [Desulfatibacillum aliphaticivorans]|uniref:Protein-tyrosine phosphatase, low molecular weight n=1 Tax=Desulfatibacillum aliphaticivorans TaxID=218208 RepID=B8FCX2_DESAL|nr:arsenate reductase ArsC [Desulfatibacillum aliphaticivorans]ACL06403.1 Protein-tyrosine phosphatase, low molecular weight [Desulfatibacillum aliphaticivorans]
MQKTRVLFVCEHNSARSRMAEAFLNSLAGDRHMAESADFDIAPVNPLAAEVMAELGMDITAKESQKVFDLYKSGRIYEFVITVCDESLAEQCPVFPGIVRRCHWSFPDPWNLEGTEEEKLEQTRQIRDKIRETVEKWLADPDCCQLVKP